MTNWTRILGYLGVAALALSLFPAPAFLQSSPPTPTPDDTAQGRVKRLWEGSGKVTVTPTQESCDEMEYQLDGFDLSSFVTMDADKAKEEMSKALGCEWD